MECLQKFGSEETFNWQIFESIVTDWEMELLMSQLSSNTTTTETGDSDTHEVSNITP